MTIDVKDPAPGIYPGVSEAIYFSIDAVNASTLKLMRRTPMHARHESLDPRDETAAQRAGTMNHCAVLEPARFANTYIPPLMDPDTEKPLPKRSNLQKAQWEQYRQDNSGKVIIEPADYKYAEDMQAAAWANPVWKEILTGEGHNEVVIIWIDPSTGLKCKARIDRLTTYKGWTVAADLKTTKDASPFWFARDCHTYGYHISAAHYLNGLEVLAPMERKHIILALEKKQPIGTATYQLTGTSLMQGMEECQKLIHLYAECEAKGEWPGYPVDVTPLELPAYAIKTDDWQDE